MKIVKFADGNWGVRRNLWVFTEYLSTSGMNTWFHSDMCVHEFCKFKTKKECEDAILSYKERVSLIKNCNSIIAKFNVK